jgi:uncharacterized protein YceK
MKKHLIVLLAVVLSGCSTLGAGKNGSPGEDGTTATETENGKNGAPGKNGDS